MRVAPESLAESKSRVETKSQRSIEPRGGESLSRKCIDVADSTGQTESTRRSRCSGLDVVDKLIETFPFAWHASENGGKFHPSKIKEIN